MSVVEVSVDTETRVGHIMLNRPEKRNALNAEVRSLLFAGLAELGEREDVSAILLTGAGTTFCAGREMMEGRTTEERPAVATWRGIRQDLKNLQTLRAVPVPVIVAIQGHCYGMGTLLVTCTDIVVVAEDATIGTPRAGGGAGYHGPVMDFMMLGRKARELELRYGTMSGKEAADFGWANYAVPAADLQTYTRELAEDVARQPRDLLEIRKASMNFTQDIQGFSLSLQTTAMWDALAHSSNYSRQLSKDIATKGLQSMLVESEKRRTG